MKKTLLLIGLILSFSLQTWSHTDEVLEKEYDNFPFTEHTISKAASYIEEASIDLYNWDLNKSNTTKIRKENSSLQFITLTFHSTDFHRQMAMEAGSDYFFSKVDEYEKVEKLVNEMLNVNLK